MKNSSPSNNLGSGTPFSLALAEKKKLKIDENVVRVF